MIVFDSSSVLVKDLKSRNGTQVGGSTASPDTPVQLSHHGELQVGKYSFRISIRDATTNEPYRPSLIDLSTLSGVDGDAGVETQEAQRLISELDDLASKLERAEPTALGVGIQSAGGSINEASQTNADRTSTEEASTEMLSRAMENSGTEDSVADRKDAGDEETIEEQGPKKLPEHLRPKAPRDSKDAAAVALRNLFVR